MKALAKLLADLVGWRWAPAVGLSVASLFYVLVVVVLVPSEIGVPMTNARFTQKTLARSTTEAPEVPAFPTSPAEAEQAPTPPPMPVQPAGMNDFGRRGFSPPIDRPEAPPPLAPPPAPPPALVATSAGQVNLVNPPEDIPVTPPPPAEAAAPAPAPAAAVIPNSPVGPTGLFRSMSAFRGLMPGAAPQPGTPPPGAQPGTPPAPSAPAAPPGAQPTPPGKQPPP